MPSEIAATSTLPHLATIDYDVAVVSYPVNPNGAKGKAFESHDLISFLPVIGKSTPGWLFSGFVDPHQLRSCPRHRQIQFPARLCRLRRQCMDVWQHLCLNHSLPEN